MNIKTFPFLLALGLAAQPALAQVGPHEQGLQTERGSAENDGYSSGGPSGMRGEAGAGIPPGMTYLDMPEPQVQGNVTYLCGGIGETEASYMNQRASEYDLKLTFASAGGAYLADIDVGIENAQGEQVLQVLCDAPILLVDLDRSGTYRINADASGFTQTRSVRVNAGPSQTAANVVVTWPRNIVARIQPEPNPILSGDGIGNVGNEEITSGGAAGADDAGRNMQRGDMQRDDMQRDDMQRGEGGAAGVR